MDQITNEELIEKARSVVNPRKIAHGFTIGDVGCALLAESGSLYLGVCIDAGGGIGFCAEHTAIASMVTHGEQQIRRIVAVLGDGTILPPCGRCREFMRQIHTRNFDKTEIILGKDKIVILKELLPYSWHQAF